MFYVVNYFMSLIIFWTEFYYFVNVLLLYYANITYELFKYPKLLILCIAILLEDTGHVEEIQSISSTCNNYKVSHNNPKNLQNEKCEK